ncbi:MAG TPA: DoxX family protein [Paludibacteraceae bacterium]|nr:DoxX family protein [Paludibacteraceae bacterium]
MYQQHQRARSANKPATTTLQKATKILLEIARILVGLTFVFSGFVKAIDPLGSTYKFEDYFTAFGGFFEHLTPIAFPAAIALSTLELLIGICFLLKIKIKVMSVVALLFMAVMTPLTLYIALKNPVTDCGCFGDAIILGNWTTFYKNLVLVALILLVLIFNRQFRNLFMPKVEWAIVVLTAIVGVGLSVHGFRHQPMIDFRPYKVGVNIPEKMVVPEGAAGDKYETTLIYQKNGQQQEFTIENYPKDSTWTFVEQKTTLVSKGFTPPIHNFSIVDQKLNDITEYVLTYKGTVNLLCMYDLSKTSLKGAEAAETLYQKIKASGAPFYALTASSDEEIDAFRSKTGATYPFCKTDPITLKTIVRGNPAMMTIKNGTIIGKWNWRDF